MAGPQATHLLGGDFGSGCRLDPERHRSLTKPVEASQRAYDQPYVGVPAAGPRRSDKNYPWILLLRRMQQDGKWERGYFPNDLSQGKAQGRASALISRLSICEVLKCLPLSRQIRAADHAPSGLRHQARGSHESGTPGGRECLDRSHRRGTQEPGLWAWKPEIRERVAASLGDPRPSREFNSKEDLDVLARELGIDPEEARMSRKVALLPTCPQPS